MQNRLLLLLGIVTTIALVLLFAVMWQRDTSVTTEPNPDGENPFPNPIQGSSGGQGTTETPTVQDDSIILRAANGGSLRVNDFLDDPDTFADPANPGHFLLGEHFPFDWNATPTDPQYQIEYLAATNYFNIALLKEPLGVTRANAEQYLKDKLGITDAQLCQLSYTVGVSWDVSDIYTSMSLGFSSCPGSVRL